MNKGYSLRSHHLKIAFIWFVVRTKRGVGIFESQRKWLKNSGDKLASPC